jgi:outer membrane protein TolC
LKTQTEALYEAGYAEKIDVARLSSNLNTLTAQLENLKRNIILGKQLLKYQMGYPVDKEINLISTIDATEMMDNLLDEKLNFEKRPDYRLYNLQVELEELNVKQYRVGYYPNLYANANLGANNNRDELGEIFSETWFPSGAVGLSLNIPIFDGLRKKAQIEQAKVSRLKAEADLSNIKQAILLETQQAKIAYSNALSNLAAQAENRDLNEEIFKLSKIKFKEGVGSSLDIVQAETGLIDARIEFFSAYYNALVARIDYMKAIGTLLEENN